MDPEIKKKSQMKSQQAQGSQLVKAGPTTRVKGACIGRKLPRTPDEYAGLKRKIRVAESSQRVNNSGTPSATKQPSQMPPKVGPTPLDNISESSSTSLEASEFDNGTSGCPPYIVVLQGGPDDDVNQQGVLASTQSVGPVANSDGKKGEYEKLNPETMDSCQGSATTGYEKLNKATMEPQTCSADLGNKGIHMCIDEATSENTCPVIRSNDKASDYEKLNRETIDSYQGSGTTGYEKLNKATMEPQTCFTDLDGTSMTMHHDKGTSQSACLVTRYDYKTSEYEKLNPETMDSYQGSATTDYEKLNKATMEPETCSADIDGTSIPTHVDDGTSQSVCPLTRSDDEISGYEKMNPETMDSYQGSAKTGYEKLNKATREPQHSSEDLDGNGMWISLGILCPHFLMCIDFNLWICIYLNYKVWDGIAYPIPNIQCCDHWSFGMDK